jgi:DNA polymerase III subunit beta
MEFTAKASTWKHCLSAVQAAVGASATNPILEMIAVEVKDGLLSLLATNLSVTIRCQGEVDVKEEGSILIPCKLLAPVIASLPNDDVKFTVNKSSVKIRCARFSGSLKGHDPETFPPFGLLESGQDFSFPVDLLKSIFRKTVILATAEKSRYELDGIKFFAENDQIDFVTTDGRRLGVYSLNGQAIVEPVSALIPSKAAQLALGSLPDEGEAQVRISDRKAQIACGDVVIASTLLVDNFPDYNRIIPAEGPITICVDRAALMQAVRRASNLVSRDTCLVILRVYPETMEIFGENVEIGGEGQDQVDIEIKTDTGGSAHDLEEFKEGASIDLRFNYSFLLDALKVMDSERVKINISEARKPAIISAESGKQYRYVLMPLRPPDPPVAEEEEVETEQPAGVS